MLAILIVTYNALLLLLAMFVLAWEAFYSMACGTCFQEVIIHECTSGFLRWVLIKYLGKHYDFHLLLRDKSSICQPEMNDTESDAYLLSPHAYGWPAHRPRLYQVGTKRNVVALRDPYSVDGMSSGLGRVKCLFTKTVLDSSVFMVASEEL